MKRIFRSKIFWAVVFVLVAIRLIVPPMIVPKVNEILAEASPTFKGHVDDIDLAIFRGAYKIQGFELRLKEKPDERFFYVKEVDISIAWRDLIKGQITSDVWIDGIQVVLTKAVMTAFKNAPKKDAEKNKETAGKVFPLKIERVDVRNSSFEFADLLSIPESARWKVSDIDARISNLIASSDFPLTLMTVSASMFKSTDIKMTGQMNQVNRPVAWDMDLEIRNFDMPAANPMIQQKVPLSFTSGKLNLYSEVKSEEGRISGYAKPFLEKADVVATGENFDGLKNFGIEVSTAAVNLILRDAKEKTLATKILFAYENGDFKINSAKAISDAIQNGFTEKIPEGLDDEISLSKKQQKADLKGEKP